VPREYSHFFTDEGRFGSLDWNAEQVDDPTYEIVDEDTFVIGRRSVEHRGRLPGQEAATRGLREDEPSTQHSLRTGTLEKRSQQEKPTAAVAGGGADGAPARAKAEARLGRP
jgi:hypothetical protein